MLYLVEFRVRYAADKHGLWLEMCGKMHVFHRKVERHCNSNVWKRLEAEVLQYFSLVLYMVFHSTVFQVNSPLWARGGCNKV